ncbi:MAG: DJ-1/PfpI family protein [Chloroflexi bacterium]|nr:DJ-1/PfpI family protein [Chloroflexota bacterium]
MTVTDFKSRVFILIASGFEEAATIRCLEQMRQASLPVSLVALSAGLVTGWYGLSVHPDLTLDQVNAHEPCKLVILPGGQMCATALLTDPRVHRLLNTLIAQGGVVGVMETAVPVVLQSGLRSPGQDVRYVIQDEEGLELFVSRLLRLIGD